MSKDRRIYCVVALMLATFLTAVDVTIVDTAMPRIVGSLGGFSLLTWVVTAYMLTSTATIPIYGKLADLYGRKSTFIFGAVIFLIGSALCGLSQSMYQLIIFRGLQGIGAGAVQPVVQTILGDAFTPAERAKLQGWFSAVWGFSALVGPLMGGLIVDHFTWRWLFCVNLPLGLIAVGMVWYFLEERLTPRKVSVDYLGSITMTIGISAFMFALLTGGTRYPWSSVPVLALFAVAAASLTTFVWQERRALDPIFPLGLLHNLAILIPLLASLMVGGILYGVAVYMPIWAQGVQGYTATQSGASLLWISIGWPISAVLGGRFIMKVGVRPAALLGMALNLFGSGSMVALGNLYTTIPSVALAFVTFVIGCGMGFSSLAFVLGVQNSVDWSQRGVATAALQFVRTLGGLVWISVMGAMMNAKLLNGLRQIPGIAAETAKQAGDRANILLEPAARMQLPPGQLFAMQAALANALRGVFLIILAIAVISLLIAFLMPNMRFQERSQPQPSSADN